MPNTINPATGQAPGTINEAIRNIQTILSNSVHTDATLAQATDATKVKTAAPLRGVIDGVVVFKNTTDDAFTLSGTITNGKFNVFVLTLRKDGTFSSYMGTEGASLATITWPYISAGDAVVGYIIVNPTGGEFVGGTTELDDTTIVPNETVYVNTPYPFNPNVFAM